jgi:hypothetical protein
VATVLITGLATLSPSSIAGWSRGIGASEPVRLLEASDISGFSLCDTDNGSCSATADIAFSHPVPVAGLAGMPFEQVIRLIAERGRVADAKGEATRGLPRAWRGIAARAGRSCNSSTTTLAPGQ